MAYSKGVYLVEKGEHQLLIGDDLAGLAQLRCLVK